MPADATAPRANAAAPRRPPCPLVAAGIRIDTDTQDTTFYRLLSSSDIDKFFKGLCSNNKGAFIPYTSERLKTVRARCSTARAAQRSLTHRCMLAVAHPCSNCFRSWRQDWWLRLRLMVVIFLHLVVLEA